MLTDPTRPFWLIMDPSRVAPVGGVGCGLLALLVYFARQMAGVALAPGSVLVGTALSFVVGYAATGIFVYFLLRVAEVELGPAEEAEEEIWEAGKGRLSREELMAEAEGEAPQAVKTEGLATDTGEAPAPEETE